MEVAVSKLRTIKWPKPIHVLLCSHCCACLSNLLITSRAVQGHYETSVPTSGILSLQKPEIWREILQEAPEACSCPQEKAIGRCSLLVAGMSEKEVNTEESKEREDKQVLGDRPEALKQPKVNPTPGLAIVQGKNSTFKRVWVEFLLPCTACPWSLEFPLLFSWRFLTMKTMEKFGEPLEFSYDRGKF